MLLVVSPAKTLDYESPMPSLRATQPRLLDEAEHLVAGLRELSAPQVSELMHISAKLGELNASRFADWERPFNRENARPALFAFKGDVYTGLDVTRFNADDLAAAQKRLRILSGLYGLLRPLDLMQPYRLEMGTSWKNPRGKDLYQWWQGIVTPMLNKDIAATGNKVLVNLASNEYYRVVEPGLLDARVITPVFQDEKAGKYKIISFYAKKARGLMAAWILQNGITGVEQLSEFNVQGYRFSARDSKGDTLVFRRREKDVP